MNFLKNQYTDNEPDCGFIKCDPLAELSFDTGMWASIIILVCLGVGLRFLSLLGLYFVSNPRKPKLI